MDRITGYIITLLLVGIISYGVGLAIGSATAAF